MTTKKTAELNGLLKEQIGHAIGHASMCWQPTPSGVFDSSEALKVCAELEQLMSKALREARDQALEEATRVADEISTNLWDRASHSEAACVDLVADKIRALKEKAE